MVELSKVQEVFLYEDHLNAEKSNTSPTTAACFLLSCFYKNLELVGKNLTGPNAKESIDADIISSILGEDWVGHVFKILLFVISRAQLARATIIF